VESGHCSSLRLCRFELLKERQDYPPDCSDSIFDFSLPGAVIREVPLHPGRFREQISYLTAANPICAARVLYARMYPNRCSLARNVVPVRLKQYRENPVINHSLQFRPALHK
jgi:hypothetical protein